MSIDCFTYGSLMCADIMHAVTGSHHAAQPARLRDFRRHPVRGEDYPGIVAAAGSEVSGVLYRNVAPSAVVRLDAFEGVMYKRTPVTVNLTDGSQLAAHVYVVCTEFHPLLEPGEWDFDAFLAEGQHRFKATYLGFARIQAAPG